MTKRARAKRDALATANLALVVSIAKRIKDTLPEHFELCELINDGVIGLLKAIDSHNPDTSPWNFWARTKIRGAILDSIGRREADEHGHTANKYLENCRLSIDERFDETRADDTPQNECERALARMAHQPTAPAAIDRARLNRRIDYARSWLSPSERVVLSLWYADDEPHPRAIARLLDMTIDQATALHDRAIEHLRARLNGGALPKAA